ncbi:hypothetical protein L7F22_041777 [Adiantum nelumboides]|nr:hypothetical protein [Adiantum nelumboides]
MTVLYCVNATGDAVPSYYIFKGCSIRGNYIQNCELGAMMAAQKKAWMTGELFSAWLHHFNEWITKTVGKSSRHLLILDGHGSHVTLDVVENARSMGIDIITLPTLTSHKLQPLDVSVFKSLKAGFRATGIWPLNPTLVRFEGMPCNRITLVKNTTEAREDTATDEETPSQVPNSSMDPSIEDEAILALNNTAQELGIKTLPEHGAGECLSFKQLMEEEDISNFEGSAHENLCSTKLHADLARTQ